MNGNRKNTGIIVAVFIILLLTATYTDLAVSKILADLNTDPHTYTAYFTTNIFGALFESIGSWPVYILLSIAFEIIAVSSWRSKHKYKRIIGTVLAQIVSVVALYVMITVTVRYVGQHVQINAITSHVLYKPFCFALACVITAGIGVSLSQKDDDTIKKLIRFAYVIIFAAVFFNVVINLGIKNFMNRPRFRAMNYLGDSEYKNFHYWFERNIKPVQESAGHVDLIDYNGKSIAGDAYRSFPSGHTAAAAMVFTLLILPNLFKKYDNPAMRLKILIFAISVTVIVAVSRIICGAHFFSDVLVGGMITVTGIYIGEKLFIKKDK